MAKEKVAQKLREVGSRATAARIAVISCLQKQERPVGIEFIERQVPDVNKVTLYRMMADFEERGLVESVDLGHGHLDYELTNRPHHHHLVCKGCGLVEDIYPCEASSCDLEKEAIKSSKKFAEIIPQQQTFFGTCKKCANKK